MAAGKKKKKKGSSSTAAAAYPRGRGVSNRTVLFFVTLFVSGAWMLAMDEKTNLKSFLVANDDHDHLTTVTRRANQTMTSRLLLTTSSDPFGDTTVTTTDAEGPLSPVSSSSQQTSETAGTDNDDDDDYYDGWKNNTLLSQQCFHVEDVCHTAGRWFYKPTNSSHDAAEGLRRQPTPLEIKLAPGGKWAYARTMMVDHLPPDKARRILPHCMDSILPNHLVWYSLYNDMLGEFYTGNVFFMYVFLSQLGREETQGGLDPHNNNGTVTYMMEKFLQQSQIYVHIYANPGRFNRLMESHHAFTSPFRHHALQDVSVLLHGTQCQCLSNLVLCGYEISHESTTTSDAKTKTILTPNIIMNQDIPPQLPKDAMGGARNLIRQRAILNNQFVLEDVANFRKSILRRYAGDDDDDDDDEWQIIGLTQRSGRRQWKDLDPLRDSLNREFASHKICFEIINVETADWTPHQHMVRHAALNGLVGIHGAQLTEAIWLPPGSLVVELLPYIYPGHWGEWVRTTHAATPLGVAFEETDLQHVGYPLGRDSAPYCEPLQEPSEELSECLRKDKWDSRMFQMNETVMHRIMRNLLVDKPKTCQEWRDGAGSDVVLYNINCADNPATEQPSVHHFYWQNGKPPQQ